MSNKEHSSQLGRTLDTTKQRLVENASVSGQKKQQRKRRPRFDRYKKSALDLVPKGCNGCNHVTCKTYVKGLYNLKLKGEGYGCHS